MKQLSRALTAGASLMIIAMLSVLIWGLSQVDWQLVMDAIIANANSEPTVIIVPIETGKGGQLDPPLTPEPDEAAVPGPSSAQTVGDKLKRAGNGRFWANFNGGGKE